jgi:anthranilate phosphoribosyltransferase
VHAGDPAGHEERLEAGIARATAAIDSGRARQVLERWIALSASV